MNNHERRSSIPRRLCYRRCSIVGFSRQPPGSQIYYAVGGVDIDYPILGIPVATLVPACFNGIIYGIIVWVVYSVVFGRGKDQQQIQQRVEIHQNVQVQDTDKDVKPQDTSPEDEA